MWSIQKLSSNEIDISTYQVPIGKSWLSNNKCTIVRNLTPFELSVKSEVLHIPSKQNSLSLSLSLHRALWRFTGYYKPTNALVVYYIFI